MPIIIPLQLNVCKMVKTRKKGYVRRGDYIEVSVRSDATYGEVCQASLEELKSAESSTSEDEEGSCEIVLMRANGTVILNRPVLTSQASGEVPWTIRSYMSTFTSFVRCGVPVKLGIGFVSKVYCCNKMSVYSSGFAKIGFFSSKESLQEKWY